MTRTFYCKKHRQEPDIGCLTCAIAAAENQEAHHAAAEGAETEIVPQSAPVQCIPGYLALRRKGEGR